MDAGRTRGSAATRNLILATIAFALCFSAWGMVAPLAPKLQDKLDLSNTETAVMIAIPVVLGSLLRIPIGLLTDRYGGRIMFMLLLAYSAGAALLIGFTTSYVALLVGGFFLGAAGSSFAVGIPFLADWYDKERQGFALGVYGMGNVGTAIAAFSVPFIYTHVSQAAAGIIYAAVLAGFTLLWTSAARNAPVAEHARPNYREVLRSGWDMWQLALFYFVTFGGFVAMAIFLPKLLKDWFDYSLTDAGLRAAGFTLVATAARPVGGWFSDRAGGPRVLAIAFFGVGIDAIGLSWQATDPKILPVTIFCLTMAGFLGLGNGAVFKLVPQMFPRSTGAVTGIVGAAGGLGGFFPPLIMGVVKDATGEFTMGFVFLVAFAWMCAGQALALQRINRPPPSIVAPATPET
ncbi:MAG: MFS transporter [Solirubrobacterales bacterium]|nr:MFS transporter [Solirubrobacterales bacterium]